MFRVLSSTLGFYRVSDKRRRREKKLEGWVRGSGVGGVGRYMMYVFSLILTTQRKIIIYRHMKLTRGLEWKALSPTSLRRKLKQISFAKG